MRSGLGCLEAIRLLVLFIEAECDVDSVECNGRGYIGYLHLGIKIIKDGPTNSIAIYNTHKGGDYYQEITGEEYAYFFQHGWMLGAFAIALNNSRLKIEYANDKLKLLRKCKKNEKLIDEIKTHRDDMLSRYHELLNRNNRYKFKLNLN